MYATQADIETTYGEDALFFSGADRDGDGQLDTAAIERALSAASAEIDTYLAARYALPLATVPEILKGLCVDIALYRLSAGADALTDEKRQRYDDAVGVLRRIGDGRAALPMPGEADKSPRPVVVAGPERQFTRSKMRGL